MMSKPTCQVFVIHDFSNQDTFGGAHRIPSAYKAPDDYRLAAAQEVAVNVVHPAGIEVLS